MQQNRRKLDFSSILTVAFLLFGAALRFNLLSRMAAMLSYDEAYEAVDALSLVRSPRAVAFFTANNGRESGFMYYLALWIKLLGAHPYALRFATMLIGILTLAAAYRLARELLDRQTAVWSLGALAALYWHIHLSHIVLRAILFPLAGTLALAFLLAAHRSNRLRVWVAGGLWLGLTAYTYFSSATWIAFALLVLGWWFVKERDRRRGAMLALGVSAALAVPMAVQLATSFDTVTFRPAQVAVFTADGLLRNVAAWLNAWLGKGAVDPTLNFSSRPILDAPTAALALVGVITVASQRANLRATAWIVGLGAISILPSLISQYAPHPLRAIGLVVPLALIFGLGATSIGKLWQSRALFPVAISLALVIWSGLDAAQTMQQWVDLPADTKAMEEPTNKAAAWIASHVAENTQVYFSPFNPEHPDMGFNEAYLAPRPVGAFDARQCEAVSASGAVYASLDMFDPGFRTRLSPWADVSVLYTDPIDPPRFRVYSAKLRAALLSGDGFVDFGDLILVNALGSLPDSAKPGDTLHVWLVFRALKPLDQVYSVFLHLYGQPTPYQGGSTWGQADSWACPSHLSVYWTPDEMLIQSFDVAIDPSAPAGTYNLAVGMYASGGSERLPITNLKAAPERYYDLHALTIKP